jgi:hypothetical protein
MSDVVKGPASYFPSIEKTYRRPIADWLAMVRAGYPARHMELVALLKAQGWAMGMRTPWSPTPWRWTG